MSLQDQVREHYTPPADLLATLEAEIAAIQASAPESLAALDQFHLGGLPATLEMLELAAPAPGSRVLDAGCGLGGAARRLAIDHHCKVTGIDLSPAFLRLAEALSRHVPAEHLTFLCADVTATPFEAGAFDLVLTQHVAMNVPDRGAFYAEARRVLTPGGRFVFYDVIAESGAARPDYPLPWAETPETSTLLDRAMTERVLRQAGLRVAEWHDVTDRLQGWLAGQPPPFLSQEGVPTLGRLMGPRFAPMAMNALAAVMSGRLRLAMGLAQAV